MLNTYQYVVLYLITLCVRTNGKTSFIKDLRTDMPFPPINTQQSVPGLPEGHLRPLGWQKKPDGKVREEKEIITPQLFYTRYIKTNRPAVLRGAIKQTPVIEKWEEDEYLKKQYGKVNVTITVKKETLRTRTKRRMLFRKFLLDYMYENWYLTTTVHEDMLPELPLPSVLSCGSYKDRLTEVELWMSSGGTSSLLHSHGDHNLHCVVDGRKDFIIIEPKHKKIFKYTDHYPNSRSGYSQLDMDMINMFKNAKVAQTPWIWTTLWQGDCLFLPAGNPNVVATAYSSCNYDVYVSHQRFAFYFTSLVNNFCKITQFDIELELPVGAQWAWPAIYQFYSDIGHLHQVRSYGRGISYTVQFAPSTEFDSSDCKEKEDNKSKRKKRDKSQKEETIEAEEEKGTKLTLADVDILWTFKEGEKKLSNKKLDPESMRKALLLLIADGDKLHKEMFEHFYNEALQLDQSKPPADEAFHIMTPNDKRVDVTRDEIVKILPSRLQHLCDIFNKMNERVKDEL